MVKYDDMRKNTQQHARHKTLIVRRIAQWLCYD